MDEETSFVVVDGVVVPESALLRRGQGNKYGSVPGLEDDELADPEELERQVTVEEWGPVLALPVRGRKWDIRPAIDESGGVDWGAFDTVDFERGMPEFDKARYKAARLREKLKDVVIMLEMVRDRMPGRAKYLVLKYLRMGVIELEHIVDEDMLGLARLDRRARRLRQEIQDLGEFSRKRSQAQLAKVLG